MKEEIFTIETTPLNAPSLSDLKAKKILLPETPCDKCFASTKDICSEKEIACRDLLHYISKGEVVDKDRIPIKDIYLKINNKADSIVKSDNNKIQGVDQLTTLQKELKLLNKLRVESLEEIDKYFNDKTTLDKAKVACVVYGLILKSDLIGAGE